MIIHMYNAHGYRSISVVFTLVCLGMLPVWAPSRELDENHGGGESGSSAAHLKLEFACMSRHARSFSELVCRRGGSLGFGRFGYLAWALAKQNNMVVVVSSH